jgi:hypothetical protein
MTAATSAQTTTNTTFIFKERICRSPSNRHRPNRLSAKRGDSKKCAARILGGNEIKKHKFSRAFSIKRPTVS